MSYNSRHTGGVMIEAIRKDTDIEELDYNYLMGKLARYKNPRDKITRLLRTGALVRVKKGLYVFGPDYSRRPFSREILANLIYGPSYISLDYALFLYGMIPERIELVTSMTAKRNKLFKTPVGNFSYTYIHPSKYPVGIVRTRLDEFSHILIASKEKALADKVSLAKSINSKKEMVEYLIDDLRIDRSSIKRLSITKLGRLSRIYKNMNVKILYNTLSGKL
jgi:predicted transcriptional regulator of viral defense system